MRLSKRSWYANATHNFCSILSPFKAHFLWHLLGSRVHLASLASECVSNDMQLCCCCGESPDDVTLPATPAAGDEGAPLPPLPAVGPQLQVVMVVLLLLVLVLVLLLVLALVMLVLMMMVLMMMVAACAGMTAA